MGDRVFERVASAAGAQKLAKAGTAGLSKGLGKAGKFVPGVGTVVALGEAAYRFSKKDTVGGIMSLGSAIPILGWGFTAFDIARDLGFDPLNTLPKEYERGTNLTKPGDAILHGTEAIFGRSDREDMMRSYQESIDKVGSTLVSSAVSLADSAGQGQAVKSELKKSGLSFDIVRMPISSKIGKTGQLSVLSSLEKDFKREIFSKKSDDPEKEQKEEDDDNKPAPPNTVVPEYDIEHNEPNSAVKMTSGNTVTYYRTNNLGGLEDEISEAEAKRIIARKNRRPLSPSRSSSSGQNGSVDNGNWIGAYDTDGNQTGLDMTVAGGIGAPIYAPVDLIYKSRGTDGMPSVGLDGTPDALPSDQGSGFGYYGAYYFKKDGKEYEVMMGHFQSTPYKGSREGEVIPKGTLLGYQGASGRTVNYQDPSQPFPHISLHVNGIGFNASNDVLDWFANGLTRGSVATSSNGGGGGERISRPERALLKTIAFAEGTTQSYGTIFGGKVIPELERGEMTVREVYNMMMTGQVRGRNAGYARGSYATGRYQFMPDTIKDIVEKYGDLRWGEKFTKEAQDRAILSRIANFRGVTRSLLEAQGLSNDVLDMLSGEFASFPTYEGVSAYNQPVKSQAKLRQMYKQFLGSIKVGPKIVGPKIVGPGKVGAGIPLVPDLTVQKMFDAIRKGISDGLDQSRDTFNKGLIPTRNVKPNQLQSNSSLMEDMEDDSMVQQVYIINNVVASSTTPFVISSSGGSNTDYVDQYRMASLGA